MNTNVIIIGAGPYGLSLASMLRGRGVEHRIFGTPMHTWRSAMPRGMRLKSEGFASDLYGPGGGFPLREFCARNNVPYQAAGLPVGVDLFAAYGEAFQQTLVPHLEQRDVRRVTRVADGYELELMDGERCRARHVVVATGISHLEHMPAVLANLPAECAGHASRYQEPGAFAGRRVAVLGGGASAADYASLLAEAGADVHLMTRAPRIAFLGPPTGRARGWLESLRAPQSGLGPGWRSRLATDAPLLFHTMPESFRVLVAKRHLGPAGGWWTRGPIDSLVTTRTGTSVAGATAHGGGVMLELAGADGARTHLAVDHVLAATGYRPNLARQPFLSAELQGLRSVAGAPKLSRHFESASPGLYFIGLSSVYDFGPLVRFAFGANFSASRLSRHLAAGSKRQAPAPLVPAANAARNAAANAARNAAANSARNGAGNAAGNGAGNAAANYATADVTADAA